MASADPIAMLQPAATRVRDPISGRSVWLAGMVQNPRMEGDTLRFDLVFRPEHSRPDRKSIEEALVANLREVGYPGPVVPFARLELGKAGPKADPVPGMSGPGMQPHGGPISKQRIAGVKHVIAVVSGKGGVGKSTLSVNLAAGLRRLGFRVGLLDADVYGPSLPLMMGTEARPMAGADKKIIPIDAHGIRCMSIGLLVPKDQAMIWRGPMVMGALRQFLQDVDWGQLDYLVIDLPPGTGDAHLTLIQAVELSGAVIVTTPQPVALADAVRGVSMYRKLEVPILGIVENMAYYVLPDGRRDYVFGKDGGKGIAAELGVPVLAEIPLRTSLRESGDLGRPAALGDDDLGKSFVALAKRVSEALPP